MKKSSNDLNPTPDSVDWAKEIEQTLAETGWTKTQLAIKLGLYVQQRPRGQGGPVSPHLYTWIRGQYKPKLYLLYALRYIRLTEGKKPVGATTTPTKSKE